MNKFVPPKFCFRQFSVSHGDWAKCLPKPDYGPVEVQRSSLLNGVKVAAAKLFGAQIGSCTIMYQAGSRYERDGELGASHFLRAISSASSQAYSGFVKSHYLAQLGASISCLTDRQSISFTMRSPITTFPSVKNYLLDTAVRSCYKQWEIDELKPLIWDDLHRIRPEQRVIDLVQKACWRGPLSNSMFCCYDRIDSMVGESLGTFANSNMTTNYCSVASVGIPFEETLKLAEMVESRRELPPPRCYVPSCPRRAYESYDLGPNSTTWIAVAVPGCGTCDIRCLTIHAIIAAACGTGNMQMSSHRFDRIPQAPLGLMSACDVNTNYKAFNISYCETGVFGIVAKTQAETAWTVTLAIVEFLSNVCGLNFHQIEIGKQRLRSINNEETKLKIVEAVKKLKTLEKNEMATSETHYLEKISSMTELSLALNDEDSIKTSQNLALQLANNVQLDNAKEAIALIDSITPEEVCCAAKNLSCKRKDMALAVVGDVNRVPNDREIGLR